MAPRRKNDPPARPLELISRASVFRREQLADGRSPAALARTLHYHVTTGRLEIVRRGVYLSQNYTELVDAYALAACLTRDGVIGYRGALCFHYLKKEQPRFVPLLTTDRLGEFSFRKIDFVGTLPPVSVRDQPDFGGEVVTAERQGVKIRVTTPERAFVDCLDRFDLGYDLETFWKNFRTARVDPRAMIRYAVKLGIHAVAARLGCLLMIHPLLRLLDHEVAALDKLRPVSPAFLDPTDRKPRLAIHKRWNLYLPDSLADRILRV
jgi:predicted transcriptional regulator of viral defense system